MTEPVLFVLNGPNLGLLGQREPAVYGHHTLADVERSCRDVAEMAGFALRFHQTEAEHVMVGWLHEARTAAAGIAINPAAFSYGSYAMLDALKMCACPIVEVHISNIHRREEAWRARSLVTPAATGIVSGLGIHGYALACQHLIRLHAAR